MTAQDLLREARALVRADGARALLGITGPPGAGKSTLAAWLVARVEGAALLPMDGFHLANSELERLGRSDRKGAPDTFDAPGFVATLERVRTSRELVYLPEFRRGRVNEAIAGALRIEPAASLVVVEGNYLLLDSGPWARVAGLLDACWYVEASLDLRVPRLVERQLGKGRTRAEAEAWATGSDQRHAELIAPTRKRATRIVSGDLSLD